MSALSDARAYNFDRNLRHWASAFDPFLCPMRGEYGKAGLAVFELCALFAKHEEPIPAVFALAIVPPDAIGPRVVVIDDVELREQVREAIQQARLPYCCYAGADGVLILGAGA